MKPWEYRPAPVNGSKRRSARVAEPLNPSAQVELLNRYHLGYMDAKVRARLAKLFQEPPSDIDERLAKARDYLNVTGEYAELYAQAAEHKGLLEALWGRVEVTAWPIGNANVLEAYLKRARGGDGEALRPVLAYVLQERVMEELEQQP